MEGKGDGLFHGKFIESLPMSWEIAERRDREDLAATITKKPAAVPNPCDSRRCHDYSSCSKFLYLLQP